MMWKTLPRSKTTENIAYYKTGKGPAILMIHGVGLRLESWGPQIQALSKEHTVIAIDLPGHGDSVELNPTPSDIDSYTHEIKLFVDEVISDTCIVIGHSLGALIAIRFAHLYQSNCDAIVALNCIHQRTEGAMHAVQLRAKELATEGPKNIVSDTLSRWFGESPSDRNLELAGICQQWLDDTNIKGYVDAYNIFANENGIPEKILRMNNLPIAFITGTLDSNSTPLMSRDMAKISPLGTAKIITGAGHMIQMTHTKEVNKILRSFALGIRSQYNEIVR